MVAFLESHWKELIATIVAIFGLWKYFDARKQELDWKKTEFLFDQAKYIDDDSEIKYSFRIIDGESVLKVSDVLDEKGDTTDEHQEFIIGFHKLLNLLDRLAYAVTIRKTITMAEVNQFGWYFTSVNRNKRLQNFCSMNGYK